MADPVETNAPPLPESTPKSPQCTTTTTSSAGTRRSSWCNSDFTVDHRHVPVDSPDATLPVILKGKDVLSKARTGMKTTCFQEHMKLTEDLEATTDETTLDASSRIRSLELELAETFFLSKGQIHQLDVPLELEVDGLTVLIADLRSKKSKSLEQGPSSLKTSSSSLFMKQQRSSSARVYDQTLKRVLAKTAFSLPYVKLSFQATTFSSDIEIILGFGNPRRRADVLEL
ncbi:hypothetical protein L1987_50491 [Smallanthus sonchifolius]|uniref:Uncharacterized protein n=1 Tax=Smallanthus sonchifolius TaxID=185202 RepID=A0ACB9EN42_9ASTR|nr:hypothetical protein L1987_50491 [Smallanthus sonchifolius]